jgi:SAM-dependent methyltransferase
MGWLSDIKQRLRRRRLSHLTPGEVFDRYYRSNKWGDDESRSGKGSSLQATAELRPRLSALLRELGVRRMLDVPCGDFHWMAHVDLDGIDYTGGDIVPALIEANRARHARPGVDFAVIDLIEGPVPASDLVFCRDCLVHLSNAHVARALANIRASRATWLLTSTFPDISENADIVTGEWRPIDLSKPPFGLPAPARLIAEGAEAVKGQRAGKMLGLWKLADFAEHRE